MKFDRRNFIRSASVLAALSFAEVEALAASAKIKHEGRAIAEDDEAYWGAVRQLFPLTKDWTYLNNGTFGPSPYPVIDAMRAGQMDADMYGNYGAYDSTMPKIAKFVGADADEIALTHNVTVNMGRRRGHTFGRFVRKYDALGGRPR